MRMASVRRSFSSQVSFSSAMIFSVSCKTRITHFSYVLFFTSNFLVKYLISILKHTFHHHHFYLQPLNGFFAGRAEDAIVEVADGSGATGQRRERRRGAHSCHGMVHCGEITPLIDSLAIIHKVLVIAQVCQRERRCMEESEEGQKEGR